jgi:hypothetical protein
MLAATFLRHDTLTGKDVKRRENGWAKAINILARPVCRYRDDADFDVTGVIHYNSKSDQDWLDMFSMMGTRL